MIKIRLLNRKDDFNDLISLSQEFFHEYEAHHKDFFKIQMLQPEDVLSYFSSFCGQSSRKAFIAIDAGRTVGYITLYVNERADYWYITRVGEISGLMIHKDYRHQGIAEKLMEQAIQFFKDKQLDYYTVFTAVANHGAIDFYRRMGLVPLYTTMIGEI
jgi:ribosomal protein S18 acetylase RimI-like enzyme